MRNPYIPRFMTNDESKAIAGMIVAQRQMDIAQGQYNSNKNRYNKFVDDRINNTLKQEGMI